MFTGFIGFNLPTTVYKDMEDATAVIGSTVEFSVIIASANITPAVVYRRDSSFSGILQEFPIATIQNVQLNSGSSSPATSNITATVPNIASVIRVFSATLTIQGLYA